MARRRRVRERGVGERRRRKSGGPDSVFGVRQTGARLRRAVGILPSAIALIHEVGPGTESWGGSAPRSSDKGSVCLSSSRGIREPSTPICYESITRKWFWGNKHPTRVRAFLRPKLYTHLAFPTGRYEHLVIIA